MTEPHPHEKGIVVRLAHEEKLRLRIRFGDDAVAPLVVDAASPQGTSAGPTGVELLASAVGTCLSQSLLHCLERSRVPVESLTAEIEATMGRNPEGRLRVLGIRASLFPVLGSTDDPMDAQRRLDRCSDLFRRFCTVAESIAPGVPVEATVMGAAGAQPPVFV